MLTDSDSNWGGWSINPVVNYQTGNPIAVFAPNNVGAFTRRSLPNVVAGVDPQGTTSNFDPGRDDRYLNRAAFTLPPSFTFGNAPGGFGNARFFPFYNENLGLMKRTNITESVNVEWRLEFFNILDRVRFGNPGIDVSQPALGTIGGPGNSPRQGQMALKINF